MGDVEEKLISPEVLDLISTRQGKDRFVEWLWGNGRRIVWKFASLKWSYSKILVEVSISDGKDRFQSTKAATRDRGLPPYTSSVRYPSVETPLLCRLVSLQPWDVATTLVNSRDSRTLVPKLGGTYAYLDPQCEGTCPLLSVSNRDMLNRQGTEASNCQLTEWPFHAHSSHSRQTCVHY